jgi:hypothetical protein
VTSAVSDTVRVAFEVRADGVGGFVDHALAWDPDAATGVTEHMPTAAPAVVVDRDAIPTPEQVAHVWTGMLRYGEDHGLPRIVQFWCEHPDEYFHRGKIASLLGLRKAQVSNWMRTLRRLCREAGLPYFYDGGRAGMGMNGAYAIAFRQGR